VQSMREGGGSGQSNGNTIWKMIWTIKILNALKMLMWRVCNDLLPTKQNLLQREVVNDASSLICEREARTVKHII
jgi:hypothetical protein